MQGNNREYRLNKNCKCITCLIKHYSVKPSGIELSYSAVYVCKQKQQKPATIENCLTLYENCGAYAKDLPNQICTYTFIFTLLERTLMYMCTLTFFILVKLVFGIWRTYNMKKNSKKQKACMQYCIYSWK